MLPFSKTATTTYITIQARNQESCLTLSFPHLPNANKSYRFYLPFKYPLNAISLFSSTSAAASPGHYYVSLDHCNSLLVSLPLALSFSKHFPYSQGSLLLTLRSYHASNALLTILLHHNEHGMQGPSWWNLDPAYFLSLICYSFSCTMCSSSNLGHLWTLTGAISSAWDFLPFHQHLSFVWIIPTQPTLLKETFSDLNYIQYPGNMRTENTGALPTGIVLIFI